jgi:hypothetical protein
MACNGKGVDMNEFELEAAAKQEKYRIRRRDRALGLSIDNALQSIKNIIKFCEPQNWNQTELEFVSDVKGLSEDALVLLMKIERKLDALGDIYATAVAPWENNELAKVAVAMDPYKQQE